MTLLRWLRSLRIPWANLPRRWAFAEAAAKLADRIVRSCGLAVLEWWPLTCRPSTVSIWGRILKRPRRTGESADDWRESLHAWRTDPVGTRGWMLDEVQRITGAQRVLEFPHDGGRCGFARCGHFRSGDGPLLVVGAPADRHSAVLAALEPTMPNDAAIRMYEPAVFDWIT